MGLEKYKSIFENIFSYQDFDICSSDYNNFESRISLLERLSEVENSSVIVFDFYKKNYAFLRLQFSEQIGYDHDKGKELGPAYYISLIHPEDIPVVLDTFNKAFYFINSLPVNEKKDFKLIYNFRTIGKDGKYYTVIHQAVVLELDKKGNIWLLLTISDMLPPKNKIKKASRQLVNIKNNMLYLFNDSMNFKGKSVLSTREIEVLGLVSKGFASKEIAEKLFISVNTVNNHRQKILEKINASNTAEAVTYARNLGFL